MNKLFSIEELEAMKGCLPKEGDRPALLKQLAQVMRENERLRAALNYLEEFKPPLPLRKRHKNKICKLLQSTIDTESERNGRLNKEIDALPLNVHPNKDSDSFPPAGYDPACRDCNDTGACAVHAQRSKETSPMQKHYDCAMGGDCEVIEEDAICGGKKYWCRKCMVVILPTKPTEENS